MGYSKRRASLDRRIAEALQYRYICIYNTPTLRLELYIHVLLHMYFSQRYDVYVVRLHIVASRVSLRTNISPVPQGQKKGRKDISRKYKEIKMHGKSGYLQVYM